MAMSAVLGEMLLLLFVVDLVACFDGAVDVDIKISDEVLCLVG
jgi:hypothetical protein